MMHVAAGLVVSAAVALSAAAQTAADDRYPIFIPRVNTFRHSRGRSQPPKQPEWKGGQWDRATGRSDRFAIRLTGGDKSKSRCEVTLGATKHTEAIRFGVYMITAYVKAESVVGRGVRMGVALPGSDTPTIWCTSRVTGTRDWRRLRMTPYLPKAASMKLVFELEGAGTAWLDDVEVVWPNKSGTFLYEAEMLADAAQVAADPSATAGKTVAWVGGKSVGSRAFCGPGSKHEPPGDYTAYFRIKVSECASASPVVEIAVNGSKRVVRTSEFRRAGVYQYFALPFTATGAALDYRARWLGGTDCWVDHVAAAPRRGLWEEDIGGPGLALDQAQWLQTGYHAVERVGQTFVPQGRTIERIDLLAKNRTGTRPGTFRLWEWKGDYHATVGGQPLFADMLDLTGPDYPQRRHWLPRIEVTPGKTYFFETQKPGQHAGIIYRARDPQAYPHGMMFSNGAANRDKDVVFAVYTRDEAAARPPAQDMPRVDVPDRQEPRPERAITKADYLALLERYVEPKADGWLRADGKHGHRHAFHCAVLYKATGDERWAERAVERFRGAAQWRRDHPREHVGFYWLPHACRAYNWIRASTRLTQQDHEAIRWLLLDSAEKHWKVRERGAMNRSMGSAFGYSMMAKLYPDHPNAEQWSEYAGLVWRDWFENRDTYEDSLHYHAVWLEFVVSYIAEHGMESVYRDPGVRRLVERFRDQLSPMGTLPPYGDCYGWGFEWGGWVMLFEAAASETHDGTLKWAAHRVFGYLLRHIKNVQAHEATYEDMPRLALAYLLADDGIAEAAPPRESKLLTRKALTKISIRERKRTRLAYRVEAQDVPDKLVLRSNAGPNDLFAVFNLMPLAGHGHFDAPALITLSCDDTALLTDTCYEDRRPEDHSQVVVKRLAGGQPVAGPPGRVTVKRFEETAHDTFCEVQCSDYTGWGAMRTRQILFVKNALIWVRDVVEFGQPMEASVGPLWFAPELAPARGANWFDVQWNEPRGFLWRWRNGDRRLLVLFVPQAQAEVGFRYQRWRTQRKVHEWSPAWCLFQKRARLNAQRGTRVHFNTLLLPHGPTDDPAKIAASVEVVGDTVDATTLEVKAGARGWRLSITDERAQVVPH